jgi:hypothetical protein
LSPDTREALIDKYSPELGMLRGLPAQDIGKINRNRVGKDIDDLNGRIADLEAKIWEAARSSLRTSKR